MQFLLKRQSGPPGEQDTDLSSSRASRLFSARANLSRTISSIRFWIAVLIVNGDGAFVSK